MGRKGKKRGIILSFKIAAHAMDGIDTEKLEDLFKGIGKEADMKVEVDVDVVVS